MSQENVEIVRRAFEALEHRGRRRAVSSSAPPRSSTGSAPTSRMRGPIAVTTESERWLPRGSGSSRISVSNPKTSSIWAIRSSSSMRITGRGVTSGVETGNPYVGVSQVRAGKIWRISDSPRGKRPWKPSGCRSRRCRRRTWRRCGRLRGVGERKLPGWLETSGTPTSCSSPSQTFLIPASISGPEGIIEFMRGFLRVLDGLHHRGGGIHRGG